MLPWDQVPEERRAIGGLADPLDEELGLLNLNLAIWMARDDSKADASVVRAGNQVMDSIDAMLRQLHLVCDRMADERREDQDIAAARADALLTRARQLQPHGYDPDSHKPGNSCTYCGRDQDDPLHALPPLQQEADR